MNGCAWCAANMPRHRTDDCGCAACALRAIGQTIAGAPQAAEDGGYQNGQRRETNGRGEPRHRTDGLRARRVREREPLKQRKETEK